MNAYKTGKDVVALSKTLKQLKELDKEILERARRQFGDLIRTPAHIQKNIFEGQELLKKTKEEVLTNREIFGRNVAFRLLPKLIFTAYLVAPKVIKSSKELLRNALTFFVENPEYSEIQKRVDKVKDKYEKYLNEVGSFVDAPWYRNLVKSLKQPEGEKFFKVQSDINKDKSKQLYIEFYNEFKSYAEFMNNKYKDVKGYEPFNIKELNKENLNKVFDIEDVPSSFIEEIFTKTAEKQKDVDGNKYTTDLSVVKGNKVSSFTEDEQNKIIELNQEIEKVLKKEQDELFETPAPEPDDDDTIIDIPQEEIMAILQKRQEKPFETPREGLRETSSLPLPAPDDDDTIIDIPQEEIMAILQGRQLKPFETPAEIRLGDNLPDFLE
jgi:hypothetical protein